MTATDKIIPAVSFTTARTGVSAKVDELGMRPMQARAYEKRGEQYLLIKSPPASGKSRALMFVALDKLTNQGVRQAIICVPERSIGASFGSEPLSRYGFFADWVVAPQWNLCNTPGADDPKVAKSKVKAVGEFLSSDAKVLVCTHATFRFAFDELGAEAFDNRLVAIDEFHHVSADAGNRLGAQLAQVISRDKAHIMAMTGSYFRGDAIPVLAPEDETRFETVTYTYYEQLNGYEHLKVLDIGYSFYTGPYTEKIAALLDPTVKTIVHIPSVNSKESLKDKHREAEDIMNHLGDWQGVDPETGFHLIRSAAGRVIKVADLVDDDAAKRDRVVSALKSPKARDDRDFVDVIIALGMAKEGFDWIWCEHALTVGYRSSLTEIIQIIGRATRDAPGKTRARFTNLIAEPAADNPLVVDAINDYLKAIAASLLMEQVLAPRFDFTPKDAGPKAGFDYGEDGYKEGALNVGVNAQGQMHFEIKGLKLPTSIEATRICREDLNEVIASFVQDKATLERGMFDPEVVPEELTQLKMGKIIREKYPELSEEDQEAVRQHAVAAMTLTQQAKAAISGASVDSDLKANTAFIDGVRKFALSVTDLDIDLIDRVNPFSATYAVLAKAMDEKTLLQVQAVINAKKDKLTYEDARALAERALEFKRERGRLPSLTSQDAWERKMAEGVAYLQRHAAKAASDG
ncbi:MULTISPECIES: DEAD/DEAH box helicase [unclassified Sphingomonas]|uniref:DEAD/DEAH box helicase n=1 Tax=Novosphingobium rhizosphaerae TaxID=1551649 RepID=UPI0015CD1FB8